MMGASIVIVFALLFFVFFIVFIGFFVMMIVRGATEWNRNNQSPVLTVQAKLIAKRTNISHHHSGDINSHGSTTYYVTFEVESGSRMEFCVSGREFGVLLEGDVGELTFQGSRFKGFLIK